MEGKNRIKMLFIMWLFSGGVTLLSNTEIPKFNYAILLICYFCELGIQYIEKEE